jgi:hypothetical protein
MPIGNSRAAVDATAALVSPPVAALYCSAPVMTTPRRVELMIAGLPVLAGRHPKGIAKRAAETARFRKAPAERDGSDAVVSQTGIREIAPTHRKTLLPNIVGNRMARTFPKKFLKVAARPLIRGTQCAFIDGHIEDAVGKGAKLLCGATHKDQYYWPTVLSGITPDMRIFHEESFGPVTSIIKVRDHEEALEMANATDYGLSSGVITNDMQKALDLAFGLEAGMVHLNDCTVSDEPHAPFGGIKNSGYGREGGRFSMEEMTELKWITIQRGQRAFPI